jgi:hypothetical protein
MARSPSIVPHIADQDIYLVLLALLLAGCQTTEERIAADDDTQCRSYGTKPGDAAYIQCRTNLDNYHAKIKASERLGNSGAPGRIR